jgi:hypothetical protein
MGHLFIVSGIFFVAIQYYFYDLYMNGIFIKDFASGRQSVFRYLCEEAGNRRERGAY